MQGDGSSAFGRYAMGGRPHGTYVISDQHQDLTKEQFFDAVLGGSWLAPVRGNPTDP